MFEQIHPTFNNISHSADVIRFVGVNGRPGSGSRSVVTDIDCCINLKLELVQLFNEILAIHIRFGKHYHNVNLQIQLGKNHWIQA